MPTTRPSPACELAVAMRGMPKSPNSSLRCARPGECGGRLRFFCILPCLFVPCVSLCLFAVGDFEAEDISSQLMERQPEAKEVLLSDDEFEDENGE